MKKKIETIKDISSEPAQKVPLEYILTLDANGGTVSGQAYVTEPIDYGKNTSQAAGNRTVVHTGYELVGWYDTSAARGGNMVFDARGFAVNGKYWNGVYSPRVSSAEWQYAGHVKAYARWVASPQYSVVTFDANGGVIGAPSCCAIVEKGKYTNQACAFATKATRKGYTLTGWYDAKSGGNMIFNALGFAVNGKYWSGAYSPGTSAATWKYVGSVIAYARWVASPQHSVVTFDANGGVIGNPSCNCAVVEKGKYTSQAGASVTKAIRAGYTLAGWYDAKRGGNMLFNALGFAVNGKYWSGAYSPGTSAATWKYVGSVIAYARWVASPQYSVVTFDANGGVIGNPFCNCAVVEKGKYTSQAGASVTKATRVGYKLEGWYDAKSGGNMIFNALGFAVNGKYWSGAYSPGISAARWKYAGNVTAYARWVQKRATLDNYKLTQTKYGTADA